jgi:predicted nuclease of predicted toxin-antitoxin system
MRIRLDESLPSSIVCSLEKRHIEGDTVIGEGLQGASDSRVLEAARQTDRLLLPLDRGFGDIRKDRNCPPRTLKETHQESTSMRLCHLIRRTVEHELDHIKPRSSVRP